ncbi:hypothetical protein [Desulfosoma sp.]
MSISYSIMTKLGGRIEVRNGARGGAIFVMNLPLRAPGASPIG